MSPPPSAVAYGIADRLAGPAGDDEARAAVLMAVAAWALREQGTIDLTPLPHARPVDGRLGFNRKRGYAEQPGLEGKLLFSMTGTGKETRGVSVFGLLTTGLPVSFETEARHDGLRHAIQTGPWRTRNPPRSVLRICKREARRAKSDALDVEASSLESRWRSFATREPDLHAMLMEDCRAGLK